MTHSPAPWVIERPFLEPGVYITSAPPMATNPIVCKLSDADGAMEANARLISAAPELLDVAESVVEWMNDYKIHSLSKQQLINRLIDLRDNLAVPAIAKAKGE